MIWLALVGLGEELPGFVDRVEELPKTAVLVNLWQLPNAAGIGKIIGELSEGVSKRDVDSGLSDARPRGRYCTTCGRVDTYYRAHSTCPEPRGDFLEESMEV